MRPVGACKHGIGELIVKNVANRTGAEFRERVLFEDGLLRQSRSERLPLTNRTPWVLDQGREWKPVPAIVRTLQNVTGC